MPLILRGIQACKVVSPNSTTSALIGHRILVQMNTGLSRSRCARRTASDWSSSQYLKFGDERTRPVRDLLSQVPLESPKRIVDLGCGPGNSTAVLAARYPTAHLTGIDSSPDMIEKARNSLPDINFTIEDLTDYKTNKPTDLLFSNAVFHWLSYTERIRVMKGLIEAQPSGGVFALQAPANLQEPSHVAMSEIAEKGPWANRLRALKTANDRFQSAEELYKQFQPICSSLNLWHTTYHHVLEDHEAIVQWVMGSGLRPFIDPLPKDERAAFLEAYLERIKASYPKLDDGRVILRYPRLFMVAVRA